MSDWSMPPKLLDLKAAHRVLMVEYVGALNYVSTLPFLVRFGRMAQAKSDVALVIGKRGPLKLLAQVFNQLFSFGPPDGPVLRYFVRLFVESHVKAQLIELGNAYLHLKQTLEENEDTGARGYTAWLTEKSEACTRFASTLSSLHSVQALVSAFWPFGVGIVTARLKVTNIYEALNRLSWEDAAGLGAVLFFPILYLFLFVASAFSFKRELFMPSLGADEPPPRVDLPLRASTNVYQTEDILFALLNRRKRREFSIDTAIQCLMLGVFGATCVWIGVSTSSPRFEFLFLVSLGVWFLISMFILAVMRHKRRKWR